MELPLGRHDQGHTGNTEHNGDHDLEPSREERRPRHGDQRVESQGNDKEGDVDRFRRFEERSMDSCRVNLHVVWFNEVL